MLNEYKKIYEESANQIPGWKKMSTLELAEEYLKSSDERYLSAIICKYWYLIPMYYNNQEYKFASEDDCYNWLIDTIIYVLKNNVWNNPDNSLYKDVDGPDKAIIVCFTRERLRFYDYTKKDKRIANNKAVRLSQLDLPEQSEEQFIDSLLKREYKDEYEEESLENYVENKIKEEFNNKEYFDAYALYGILSFDLYERAVDGSISFSEKKLKRFMRRMDKDIYKIFSNDMNISIKKVERSLKYIKDIDGEDFTYNLFRFRKKMLKDKLLMEFF